MHGEYWRGNRTALWRDRSSALHCRGGDRPRIEPAPLSSCPEQLYEFIGHKAGFEQLQSCLWNVRFGLTVETSTVGPVDPRPPKARHRAAKAAAWSSVF